MIERVTRAISPWYDRDDARDVAVAAIKAIRDPTMVMLDAGWADAGMWVGDEDLASPYRVWQAMIDAALAEDEAAITPTPGTEG